MNSASSVDVNCTTLPSSRHSGANRPAPSDKTQCRASGGHLWHSWGSPPRSFAALLADKSEGKSGAELDAQFATRSPAQSPSHPARGLGGTSQPENPQLLFRAHNRLAAERVYGKAYVSRAIARSRAGTTTWSHARFERPGCEGCLRCTSLETESHASRSCRCGVPRSTK
jgi:hypothetical protein